jgi:hypothetical protein
MVTRALVVLAFALAAVGANAGGAQDDPYAIPAYKITPVKSVVIKENDAWTDHVSGHETPEQCKAFQLTARDIREFFRKARHVSRREYGHDLDMAMCYAAGEIEFRNGERGEWEIDQARRGGLRLSDGRMFYFYCPKCSAKVFAEP